jgi:DNA polymerase-3 subunit gamma/tau
MPQSTAISDDVASLGDDPRQYVVVARRYRPQTFAELIGQEHVAQALTNAIAGNRVGHAYLFTGARGVGKTSAARILAKALDCEQGPTPTPCNQCDICRTISAGEDVDVLEIDGASNRGIDEIRQLRQNAGVRPSRARYKIYIIDEVHMLTKEAFNALLKTLEEPPEHVKFIFCTTEPTKIPITILSRCQRFDFAGIETRSILRRLEQIAQAEGVAADREALELIARRAAGSMRDSQSLLEQLLSFSAERITTADVREMLGEAGEERLAALVGKLLDRDPAGALAELDAAVVAGIDPGQLIEQLFGHLRDCMLAAAGCPAESFLFTSPAMSQSVIEAGKRWGLNTLLAVLQILDHALDRMRYSTQGRILAELALVTICQLGDLDNVGDLLANAQSAAGSSASSQTQSRPAVALTESTGPTLGIKKKSESSTPPLTPAELPVAKAALPLSEATALEVWRRALERISGMTAEHARQFDSLAFVPPNRLVICFKSGYAVSKEWCDRTEQIARLEKALAEVAGCPVRVEFTLAADEPAAAAPRAVSHRQRLLDASQHPLVRRAGELFGAQPINVESPSELSPKE